MLKDILNRKLKIGDMVLYVRVQSEIPIHYGLVISEKAVFDGVRKYYYAEDCILVTNFDEFESKKYQELVEAYNLYELDRQKKKLRNQLQLEPEMYGLYRNGRRYYVYLGKMSYSNEFIVNRTMSDKVYRFYGNTDGYAYFKFNDTYSSNRILKKVLETKEFNLIEALCYKDSLGILSPHLSISVGYSSINLYRKVIPYDEYLGKIELKGISNDGSISLYNELVKIYGSDLVIDRKEDDYLRVLKDCYLIKN